jgi:hypothetical protein
MVFLDGRFPNFVLRNCKQPKHYTMKDQKQAYLSPETEVVEMVTDHFCIVPLSGGIEQTGEETIGW